MYECRPQMRYRRATVVVLLLLGLSGTSFLYGIVGEWLPWLGRATAFLWATLAAMVAERYLFRRYVYTICEGGNGMDLLITEVRMKRSSVTCRIGLETVTAVFREGKKSRKVARKRRKGLRCFSYCDALFCRNALSLHYAENGEEVVIRFSPDDAMEGLLRKLSGVN